MQNKSIHTTPGTHGDTMISTSM